MSRLSDAIADSLSFSEKRLSIHYLSHSQEASQTDDGKDVIQGLTQTPKTLPPRYFYDDKGSQLFEQICELPEYYPTRTEAWILEQYAPEIARCTGACELVELGSGSSTKTRLLLTAYGGLQSPLHYLPIDVSGGILEESARQLLAEYPMLHVRGLVGTYEQALAHLEPPVVPTRMMFFLGSTLGNFTASQCDRFILQVKEGLSVGDYFLLGLDLQKPKALLEAAYNDSQGVTAAFNLNMLAHLNWRFRGNFNLDWFSHEAVYNEEAAQIEMYLHCQRDCTVCLEALDLTIEFHKNESILTEISRKFDLEEMSAYLRSRGLETTQTWRDPKGWFGLVLVRVRG
jgi:L-histidine N-alpha-methyltransferase